MYLSRAKNHHNKPSRAHVRNHHPKQARPKTGIRVHTPKDRIQNEGGRIPEHWDVQDITDSIDYLTSLIEQYEDEITESRKRSKTGKLSNRLEKLETAIGEIRAIGLPKV